MTEFIWRWKTDNNNVVYTRQADVAEQALQDGFFVMGLRAKPRVYRR